MYEKTGFDRWLVPWLSVSVLAIGGCASLSPASSAVAPTPVALKKLTLRELMDLEVTSISRGPTKLSDSAASIQVITRDDIRRSGATTLAEALRLAPNLQIAQVNGHDWAITARGFNGASVATGSIANKLLVMIDGRSIYTPLFGGVFWDAQHVPLDDIDRIEVVSGPGGTLWGANAVNGVINIITRSATDTALRDEVAERQNAEAQIAELNEKLEARVRERTAQLERANHDIESFSYSVSHDLRAPLRAVDGYARLLEEDHADALNDDARRLLSVVRDEARRMGVLIDDLLNFSRLSRHPLRPSPVNLGSMAEEIVRELRRTRPERTIDLAAATLPIALADAATMRQVLVNLLSNAVKYAKSEGAIRIELGGRRDGAMNEYWVRDEGVGFDMRYVDKIFGVFQRLHGDEFEGTGVGLAIVDRIVAKHGGAVRAEGAIDAGACFHFTLPAAANASEGELTQ